MAGPCYRSVMIFRPLHKDDFDLIAGWLTQPHVAKWWDGPVTRADMDTRYGPRLEPNSPVKMFIAEIDGTPVGRLQYEQTCTWLPDFGPEVANVDFQIGEPEFIGKGLGPLMINQFVEEVILADARFTRVISDPDASNARSIRALEKAGFSEIEQREIDGKRYALMERSQS